MLYCHAVEPTRRLASPGDYAFARQVHHLAYRDVVERQFGEWDEQRQDRSFDGAWSQRDHEIIEWDAVRCGYAAVEYSAAQADVHELVLHPDYQGRGIGTAFLHQTISRADELGVPVYLQVLHENPAANLYERLGFEEYDRTSTHRLMRR